MINSSSEINTPKNKLWSFPLKVLFLINVLSSFGFCLTIPIVPKYLVSIGASLASAGAVAGAFALTALITRPFTGIIVDKFNNRLLMAIATFMVTITMFGYSFSKSVQVFLFIRIINGIFFAINSTVVMTLATSLIPKERMGQGLSMFSLGQILAMATGPSTGIYISKVYGYSNSFVLVGIIMIVVLIAILIYKFKPRSSEASETQDIKIRLSLKNFIATETLMLTFVGACFSIISGIITTFIVLYADNINIANIGIFFTVNALVLVVSRMLFGKIIDKVNLKFIVLPSLTLVGAALVCLSLAHSIWMIIAAAALYAMGQGVGQPALQAECIKRVELKRRGVATSTFFLGIDAGQGFGPTIGGSVSEAFGYRAMYFTGLIPLLIGAILFGIYSKYFKNKNNK